MSCQVGLVLILPDTTSKRVRLVKMNINKISEIDKIKQRHGKQLYHLIYALFIVNWFLMTLREQREYPQS
jgi:hypothetical protein